MKIHPVKNQTLNVTAETMDIGMTGIDYLGAKEVQFIEVSATDPEFGATFRVICNYRRKGTVSRSSNWAARMPT